MTQRINIPFFSFWDRLNIIFLAIVFLFLSCGSRNPAVQELPIFVQPSAPAAESPPPPRSSGGVAEEIRSLVENGSPPSLLRALDQIRSRQLETTEFGRLMNAVAVNLLQKLYPAVQAQFLPVDPPQTHAYAKILREAERGTYTPPSPSSNDYLEHILPFIAFIRESRSERLLIALPDLEKGRSLNPSSVLAPFFLGLVYERSGRTDEAFNAYTLAYGISAECYPAAIGLARIMETRGQLQDAIRIFSDLVIRNPDNIAVKRQLAIAYYRSNDWSRAEPAIAEILQRDSRDRQFILMRAHVLVEQGQFLQAQVPLDIYGTMDTNNRLYLFLRARVQAEGYRNRDAALNYLRSILRNDPDDGEASLYAARLLMESNRQEDQAEGAELLRRLLDTPNPSPQVRNLAVQDAIRRQAWAEAQGYLEPLLRDRRSSRDLFNSYTIEQGLGNNAAALQAARELYERDPSNEDGITAYISALIDTGRQDEAGRMIESRLASLGGGVLKGRYYYLRSRLRGSEESVMNDLRSCLFEDPRNLNALIAMFEIYQRRRDDRRAVYYLKQALALAPDNPRLKRWEVEYAAQLGN
ncbi:MAG: tetratricopeptide repeat protein [Treponema sp.]|nr:tetratricopeptide repeat protein [Treponema sp.]